MSEIMNMQRNLLFELFLIVKILFLFIIQSQTWIAWLHHSETCLKDTLYKQSVFS